MQNAKSSTASTMTKMLMQMRAMRRAARAVAGSHSAAAAAAVRPLQCVPAVAATRANDAARCNGIVARSFQTSALLMKQHTTDVTEKAKRSVGAALATKKDDESDGEESGSEDEEEDEDEDDSDDEAEEAEIDAENPAAAYIGVKYYPSKVKKYSAELSIDGHVISGGDYWTALDAAKGYDELVDLYCDLDTPRNFSSGSADAEEAAAGLADASTGVVVTEGEWEVPEVGKRHADMIPPIPQYVQYSMRSCHFE